jgi:hypothetical protein
MTNFELMLEPDSTALPDCRCGKEMSLARVELAPVNDAQIRIFNCSGCDHEMRLTVWAVEAA